MHWAQSDEVTRTLDRSPSRTTRRGPRTASAALALTLLLTFLLACAPTAAAPTAVPVPAKSVATEPGEATRGSICSSRSDCSCRGPGRGEEPAVEPQGSVVITLPGEAGAPCAVHDAFYIHWTGRSTEYQRGSLQSRIPVTMELVGELATTWEQVNPTA